MEITVALITSIGTLFGTLITAVVGWVTVNKQLRSKLDRGEDFRKYLVTELVEHPELVDFIRRMGGFVVKDGPPGTETFEKLFMLLLASVKSAKALYPQEYSSEMEAIRSMPRSDKGVELFFRSI